MFNFLSPGSVQAEVQLETASPNMSVVLQVVSSMDNLGNFSLDRNVTAIRSEPGNVVAMIHITFGIRTPTPYFVIRIYSQEICYRAFWSYIPHNVEQS